MLLFISVFLPLAEQKIYDILQLRNEEWRGEVEKRESRDAKVIHFFPNSYFYFERGIAAFREEKIKEAIGYLERAHELEPREPVVMCQLAICYTEIGQFHKSNQFLRYILENLDEYGILLLFYCQ
ncbi:tetratricopeptide repeat protein [Listeria aquatica]|uniref:tetratricopeptide repeat protein n=1 Tax=Listeria aquatica TaxID=1494960 RepID=UPI0031F56DD2